MSTDDTIVSIATAAGVGAISIVRLSGKDALKIALSISRQKTLRDEFPDKYLAVKTNVKGDKYILVNEYRK